MTVKTKDSGIKVKVKWAQSILGTKREINFDDMDFNQFVFGESRLINRNKIDLKEKETRIHLMQRIPKLNLKFGFEVAKEMYRDTLMASKRRSSNGGTLLKFKEQRWISNLIISNLKLSQILMGKQKGLERKAQKTKPQMSFGGRTLILGDADSKLITKGNSMENK